MTYPIPVTAAYKGKRLKYRHDVHLYDRYGNTHGRHDVESASDLYIDRGDFPGVNMYRFDNRDSRYLHFQMSVRDLV